MPLTSRLFRGDSKLEAAAVSDPAHITIGAKGDHVRKIQQALTILDGVDIDLDGAYGHETAAAVLAYKQKRNIINRSYQTKADNIVGKMTMAALDDEMKKKESDPVVHYEPRYLWRRLRPRKGVPGIT
jgi:peptidoglycan hydrolase-like protein with peptidoglycan-binding domain